MTTKQMSFADLEIIQRLLPDTVLVKLNALIDWEAFRPLLKGVYKRDLSNGGGQEPHDALMMFKATLLGQWHSLSDPALEVALRVRIDFIVFCGLDLASDMPDETTLCRFRNRLVATGKLPLLLSAVNAQLQANGLMVKASQGAVLDATLVQSAARPRSGITLEIDSQGQSVSYEDGSQPGVVGIEPQSADTDATWLKKGKKSHYGYRCYVPLTKKTVKCGAFTAPLPTRAKSATLKPP